MGFDVKSVIVSERDDFTLRDPANGSYNYNAPGSHRYRIDLELLFAENSDRTKFFELVRYSSGEVTKKFDNSQYAELVKMFAQRTYEQLGNFITKPFSIAMKEKDETNLFAELGDGKAYVYGYEYESAFKDKVQIPKARDIGSFTDIEAHNKFENFVIGKYKTQQPRGTGARFPFHTDITVLFNGIDLQGNGGNRPIIVYGTTGAALSDSSFMTNGFEGAVFTALLHKIEFVGTDGRNDTVFGQGQSGGTFGVDTKAYLSNINVLREPLSNAANTKLNLYSIDTRTGVSTRVLFDLNTLRDAFPESNSLLPQFNNFNKQQLLYPLNGNTPTTLVENVDELSYTHTVYRSFTVAPDVPGNEEYSSPLVPVSLGDSSFKWCDGKGNIPANTEFVLTEQDQYYVVFTGTTNFSNQNSPIQGELYRIVSPGTPDIARGDYLIEYPTAKITANGTHIKFTKALYPGQWTLIGKVKATEQTISASSTNRIRTKTLVSNTETIKKSLQTYKRVINNKSPIVNPYGQDIYSVYFLLDKADVHKIDSITDGNNQNADISYKFEFDSGQRDSIYGLGRLYVKPKYLSEFANKNSLDDPSYNFTVNYSYFSHAGYGPFVAQSYENSGISFDAIPLYSDPNTGRSINLVNAVDYRPVETLAGYRIQGSTGSFSQAVEVGENNIPVVTYEGGFIPIDNSIKSDHSAYLPRIDKIVVSKNIGADEETTTLRRVPGTSSEIPQIPEDLKDSMTLAILSVPAYTYNPDDVKPQAIANKHMTMKDIIDVSKRVDDLEQHVVVSDIETNALYRDIKTSDGSDAIKRAVLVDSFDGHSIGDVLNPDYRCSIDLEKGELRPAFDSNAFAMEYVGNDPGLTLTPDNILCEVFTRHSTPVIEQTKASTTTAVNPFGYPNWIGDMFVSPHGDFWFDRDFRPTVKYNDDGVNDGWVAGNIDGLNGHTTQWNDWESLWTGLSTELTEAEGKKNAKFFSISREKSGVSNVEKKFFNREGILRETEPIDSNKNIYEVDFRKKDYYANVSTNTVINTSVVPFMRDQILVFNAYNMKPGTQVHVFVDNVNMNDLCYRYDDSVEGLTLYSESNGSLTGPFTTDPADGSLRNVVLSIPRGIFEAGERLIRVTDDPNNDLENTTTVAESVFFCNGIKRQNPLDIQSVRIPDIKKQTPNSSKVVSTPLFKRKSINTIKYNNWVDPMAQTFEVREDIHPNGFYAESVDVFFATIDDELPITLRICPVINGVPHTSVILPFSTVIKNPSDVVADPSSPTPTTFKFTTPVFLAPGNYAIVLHTNSNLYNVYTANIGEKDLLTDERISSTFSGGSLFKSQNNSETIGENNTDLMFKLYRCQFQSAAGNRTFSIRTIAAANDPSAAADEITDISLIQPNLFAFLPENISMSGSMVVESKEYFFSSGRSVKLSSVLDRIDDQSLVTLDITVNNLSSGMNTFMIDMDKTNLIAVSYIINSSAGILTEETPYAFRPKRKRRRRLGYGYFATAQYKQLASQISRLGDRPIPNNSDGIVGAGLSKRGRKKWAYNPRGFVPQYITTILEDLPVIGGAAEDDHSRYITRYASISNGLSAKELKVYFDANIPVGASISLFAKTLNSTIFAKNTEEQPYHQMTEDPSNQFVSLDGTGRNYSVNEQDFKEISFSYTAPIDFNTFLVKICMYSLDKINVPVIKNLRVVAVE
jgi:hypothetical protein